jgi:DNA excision repair protein ERCC-4
MTLQLPFQQEIFTQLLEKDGMLVLARGLGLERCITSFLQLAAERYTLVILLNATSEQEERFSKALQAANEPKTTLHVIKNDVKAEDR